MEDKEFAGRHFALGLTGNDWAEFEKKFPAAQAWLTERKLRREHEYLKSVKTPNDWQRQRLTELNQWREDLDTLKRHHNWLERLGLIGT